MRPVEALPPVVLVCAALLLALPGTPSAAPPESPLADSVLATVGDRDVTIAEFLRQWRNLDRRLRPQGPASADVKRAFLDELINKEVLSMAAGQTGYAPTGPDSVALANLRTSLLRQEYYRRHVLESEQAGDRDMPVGEREARLIDELVGPLGLRFDDEAAALLARSFSKLPSPREQGPGWMRLQFTTWLPPVLPADTARVLATSKWGPFTIGRFLWFWERVPAAQRDRPDSAQGVIDWTKSFFAQGRIDEETERLGYGRLPEVEAQLAARRQILAVESYYREEVLARVDTSDAVLETTWKKDPERYRGMPHDLYLGVWYPGEGEAEAAVAALGAGAAWDSLLAARFAAPGDPEMEILRRREADLYREAQVLGGPGADSTLGAWFAKAEPGQAFGPRARAGQWWVYRFLEHRDGRPATFAEARPLVLRQRLAEEGEAQLTAHLEELRGRYGVRVNEAALAALELPADPPLRSPHGQGGMPVHGH